MGKKLIAFSIDLTKVDKNRIKLHTKQNGEVAKYYNMTMSLDDAEDNYGNHAMITESITKEEREADKNKKGTILGNGKVVWSTPNSNPAQSYPAQSYTHDNPTNQPSPTTEIDDDVPF